MCVIWILSNYLTLWLSNKYLIISLSFSYGHTFMKIPALVRSRKSSMKRSSQYCGGRPRGNTGCCSFCILQIWNFDVFKSNCFKCHLFSFICSRYISTRSRFWKVNWNLVILSLPSCSPHTNLNSFFFLFLIAPFTTYFMLRLLSQHQPLPFLLSCQTRQLFCLESN